MEKLIEDRKLMEEEIHEAIANQSRTEHMGLDTSDRRRLKVSILIYQSVNLTKKNK